MARLRENIERVVDRFKKASRPDPPAQRRMKQVAEAARKVSRELEAKRAKRTGQR